MGEQNSKGNRTLVKCLVCGDIFDSSHDICPVCGVGSEFFIPYEEEKTGFRNDTTETFVILGNGAAGISAAEAIRERNETCNIIMISEEESLSYNRTMLTKSLSTLVSAESILIHEESWYQENNISNILGVNIISIQPEQKTILLSDGQAINYDKCIYALGAECFVPPINGKNKEQVVAIRNIADVKKIKDMFPSINNTVVIGGGVLGLEAAWEMSKVSKVTVLEVADKLMGRQVDDAAGELLGNIIVDTGIDFKLNVKINEITGDDVVTGVRLEDGELISADLVIVSCGIRSNTDVAKSANINIDRAIVVNDKMETNVSNIFACGDCAQYEGINYALWPEAVDMGKIAGANAVGEEIHYEQVPANLTFDGMNTKLFAAGDNGKNPSLQYATLEYKNCVSKQYEKYYFVEDRLVGCILIGDTSKTVDIITALKEGRSYKKFMR